MDDLFIKLMPVYAYSAQSEKLKTIIGVTVLWNKQSDDLQNTGKGGTWKSIFREGV